MNLEDIQKTVDELSEPETDVERAVESLSDLPLLSPDALKKDKRRTDIVEVNFANLSVEVVTESSAPKLTPEVLKEHGKPIKTVGIIVDGDKFRIDIRHGKPIPVDIEQSQIYAKYAEELKAFDKKNETDDEAPVDVDDMPGVEKEAGFDEFNTDNEVIADIYIRREDELKLTLLARMIDSPVFSYGDHINIAIDNAHPIAELSPLLVNTLWEAYCSVNLSPVPLVYQCTVLRGMPKDAAVMLRDTFELYPVKSLLRAVKDMTDDDIQTHSARELAQRRVIVSSMILDPPFSLNGEGKDEAFPIEGISDGTLEMLFNAYKAVNRPKERLSSLNRFRRVVQNGKGS